MRKQKKVKIELETATYRDYVRHFGVVEGAKKWKEHKDSQVALNRLKDETDKIVSNTELVKNIEAGNQDLKAGRIVEDLEPIQRAVLEGSAKDVRKSENDMAECGTSAIEFIQKPIWNKWIKPQIQKDMIDFIMKATMSSGEVRDEAMGGYKYAKKLLGTINKWINDFTYLLKEQEKKNAIQTKR